MVSPLDSRMGSGIGRAQNGALLQLSLQLVTVARWLQPTYKAIASGLRIRLAAPSWVRSLSSDL
eukprot:3881978-Pyramimonas_sp.AAC.1